MARKSRKNINVQKPAESNSGSISQNQQVTEVVNEDALATAAYIRLSVENNGHETDNSLKTQIELVESFIRENGNLHLIDTYIDNGFSGTKFDRPEFVRMMDDVKSGRIQCIVVKDLSRFGRDYIETGAYLEKIFPFMGVRFISITDGYDSAISGDAEKALMVPLKNMINAAYAKDISRKIITSFRARQEKGEILPAFAPYG